MGKEVLERYLAEGMSLEEIGVLVNRDASTVGYWVKKHGLRAVHADKYAPRGGISKDTLVAMVNEGISVNQMALRLDLSTTTVHHWMRKYGLQTVAGGRRQAGQVARRAQLDRPILECRTHGPSAHVLEGDGLRYRCARCRSAAVSRRRRKVKKILVEEFGGCCQLCGYDRCIAVLHFHHLDPSTKDFGLAQGGVARSIAAVRNEARKCVLLCSNCHGEVEAKFSVIPDGLLPIK